MRPLQFDEVRVLVSCQYYENYAFESGGEAWKPKGGTNFAFNIKSDEWFYLADTVVKPMIESLIESKCDNYCRYEIVSYDTIFEDPTDITDELVALESGL